MHNKALNELLQKVNVVKMHCQSESMLMVVEDKITKEESFIDIEDSFQDSSDGRISLRTTHYTYEELIDNEAYQWIKAFERNGDCYKYNNNDIHYFITNALSSLSYLDYKDDSQIRIDVNNKIDEQMTPILKERVELKQGLVELKTRLVKEQSYEQAAMVRKALRIIK